MDVYVEQHLFPIKWTPKGLKETRESIQLTQQDVANILGVTRVTIKNIELGYTTDPLKVFAYGTILERYLALKQGYTTSYRKIGTSEFCDNFTPWL